MCMKNSYSFFSSHFYIQFPTCYKVQLRMHLSECRFFMCVKKGGTTEQNSVIKLIGIKNLLECN